MKETRWAIVGTGYIANEFAKGMQEAAAAELVAVVSRSEENERHLHRDKVVIRSIQS